MCAKDGSKGTAETRAQVGMNWRCTNPRCQITWTTKFCMVARYMCEFSEWDVLNMSCQVPRILRCLSRFWGNLWTLA